MISEAAIREVLGGVSHPENGRSLGEMVSRLRVEGDRVWVTLLLTRARDPFAKAVRQQAERAIGAAFPGVEVIVSFEEPPVKPVAASASRPAVAQALPGVGRVIAISSAKGGVGKSTVAANLALALAAAGQRVGILDADIYGPSQPLLFGMADYSPTAAVVDGVEMLAPAEARGVKVMSIGFFIDPSDALVWRGPMATSALRQLLHQSAWGELDTLLVDLPPGTGDVHLTLLQELRIDGAIVVTTPQQLALADVERGIAMFRAPAFDIPIVGLVENMAWFTPDDRPGQRYHPFGRDGGRDLAEALKIPLLGQIPISPTPEDYIPLATALFSSF